MQIDSFLESSELKNEKNQYPSLPFIDLSKGLSAPKNLLFNAIHIKRGKGLSRKTFMHFSQNSDINIDDKVKASLSLTENKILFDLPPNEMEMLIPVEEEEISIRQVDDMGRFVFNTEEGFNDTVPSNFIEPIHHHHETDHKNVDNKDNNENNHINSHEPTDQAVPSSPAGAAQKLPGSPNSRNRKSDQGTPSSATTAAVQRPLGSPNSRILKSDRPHSNYPVVYSSVYSRPPHSPNITSAPMMIIVSMNGLNRPIVKEFKDHKFPKIHLFSCPNYTKSVFAPLPTERPPPLTTYDVLKFNPPKIEMCEFCRVTVNDPVKHRESETHKRRALDTDWSQIDKIILETQNNLENWPYKPVKAHSKV